MNCLGVDMTEMDELVRKHNLFSCDGSKTRLPVNESSAGKKAWSPIGDKKRKGEFTEQ